MKIDDPVRVVSIGLPLRYYLARGQGLTYDIKEAHIYSRKDAIQTIADYNDTDEFNVESVPPSEIPQIAEATDAGFNRELRVAMAGPISIIMQAELIPDCTKIFKVSGTTPYILRRGLRIYGPKQSVFNDPDHQYIFGNSSVSQVEPDKKLRIEFKDADTLTEFLGRIKVSPGCHAGQDGDCNWLHCPQNRDGEPAKTGRHCPLDKKDDDDV